LSLLLVPLVPLLLPSLVPLLLSLLVPLLSLLVPLLLLLLPLLLLSLPLLLPLPLAGVTEPPPAVSSSAGIIRAPMASNPKMAVELTKQAAALSNPSSTQCSEALRAASSVPSSSGVGDTPGDQYRASWRMVLVTRHSVSSTLQIMKE
jgi:hypothetical protein